jgi:hypothetical protein
LKKPLGRAIQRWKDAADRLRSDERHRPIDYAAIRLGLEVAWALDDGGVELKTDKQDTQFMEVLRLVRRWADELEGRKSPPRKYIRNIADDILRRYKPWRTRVEKLEAADERRWTNYERRRDAKPTVNRARSLKSSDLR